MVSDIMIPDNSTDQMTSLSHCYLNSDPCLNDSSLPAISSYHGLLLKNALAET